MSMWVTAKNPARPDVVMIHRIVDRRGRRKFLATMGSRALCTSRNPVACAAVVLLGEGRDPATRIEFRDADEIDAVEHLTLAEAIEWQVPGLGSVVSFRQLTGGDAA